MTLGQVLEHGGDHPTGPAPRRPEIDDYGHGRSRLSRERVGVRIDEPGQLGLALRASRDSPSDRTHAIASIARRASDDRHHHYQSKGPSSRSRLPSPPRPRARPRPSLSRREGHAPIGRPRPPRRRARPARRPARGRCTQRPGRRCAPTFAGAVIATPLARALERDGESRTSWSSSRSRRQCRWARSPPSRCLPGPCHGSECRSRQPSACRGASARWTASSV